jgi:hypothetical protein
MYKKATIIFIISCLLSSLVSWQFFATVTAASNPPVLITEVQTGFIDGSGVEYPKQEFIELTNVSPSKVNVTNWTLEYLSAANSGAGAPTTTISTLSGQINLNGHALLTHVGYLPVPPDATFGDGDISSSGFLAKSGGHVRLMNGSTMIDCVSWGSASVIAGCDKVTATAPAGYSLQRPFINNFYDKSLGVVNLTPPNPQGGELWPVYDTSGGPANQPGVDNSEPTSKPVCDNILLSEILPNPAGDDTQGEFIELYNPTNQLQSLYGCSLKVGTKQYIFPAEAYLLPSQYKAFPFSTTSLTLANGGGEVDFITTSQVLSTVYPSSGDDQAWALSNGTWFTTTPTPNSTNPLTGSIALIGKTNVDTAETCAAGKYLSTETNRCRNIQTTAVTTSCATGYMRNPVTNRCTKVVVSPTTAVTCQKGYEKNPQTNRCRKITTPATSKTCPAGQERNATTNRCRKIVATTKSNNNNGGVASAISHNYRLIAVVLVLAFGYAVYEYRQDFNNLVARLKNRRLDNDVSLD